MLVALSRVMRNTLRVKLIALVPFATAWAFGACSSRSASGDIAAGSSAAAIDRGRALATFGGCHDCHTPKRMTPAGPMLDSMRLLSGHPAGDQVPPMHHAALVDSAWAIAATVDMTAWIGPWGETFAANLTPDATGLAGWTADQFIQTMRTGRRAGTGRALLPPMPWQNLTALSDDDLRALFAYLQSLKPVSNTVPPARVAVTTARR
jgi:mono/diheme cytochrome c family protein